MKNIVVQLFLVVFSRRVVQMTTGIKTDQWNRPENPEINAHICRQIIFDNGVKTIQWERTVFLTNGARKTVYPLAKD